MTLFGRSGGYYLFWLSAVYLVVGLADVKYRFIPVEYLQMIWIACLAIPFLFPPFGRWLNMDVNWDRKMFNKETPPDNVIKFPTWNDLPPPDAGLPKPKLVPPMPEVVPPKEEPAKIYYRIGVTDQQRISFSLGVSEITMNKMGCQHMIEQLTVFMNQLEDTEKEGEE